MDPKLSKAVSRLISTSKPCMDPRLVRKASCTYPKLSGKIRVKDLHLHASLYKAAAEGNWEEANKIFQSEPNAKFAKIGDQSVTALHVAAESRQTKFVIELVRLMQPEDLEVTTDFGYTALHLSVIAGDMDAAKVLVEKNPKLTQFRAKDNRAPIFKAARGCFKDLLQFLCENTKDEHPSPFRGVDGANLLNDAILAGFYDVALDLVQSFPELAIGRGSNGATALETLAQKSSAFMSGSRLGFWQSRIYSWVPDDVGQDSITPERISRDEEDPPPSSSDPSHKSIMQQLSTLVIQVPRIKEIYKTKLMHNQAKNLVKCICEKVTNECNKRDFVWSLLGDAVLLAAKFGIVEFIEICLESYPQLFWYHHTNWHSMLHVAIIHRQLEVFKFVQGFGVRTNRLANWFDGSTQNYLLHLAAILPAKHVLDAVSGEALQMQRELQWYKKVELIVQPKAKEFKNLHGKTPRVLFTEEHRNLVEKGEKWMKDTATSCMVVATLIATVVFAAAFTVPGGINNIGVPFFLEDKAFKIFAIADALALFSSSTSVLIFLSILTSRYAEEDFLESIPRKLIIGLFMLFFSIASMMVAFSVTFIIMLGHQLTWVPILISILASFPVCSFALSYLYLLIELFRSTYGSDIFQR